MRIQILITSISPIITAIAITTLILTLLFATTMHQASTSVSAVAVAAAAVTMRRLPDRVGVARSLLAVIKGRSSHYRPFHSSRQCRMACEWYCPSGDRSHRPTTLQVHLHHHDHRHYYPPQICHIRVTDADWRDGVVGLIRHETGLPSSYIAELIAFGSVYVSLSTTAMAPKVGLKVANTAVRRLASVAHIDTAHAIIPVGSYLRVHVCPNRYYGGHRVTNWSQRVLSMGTSWLVVDKPFDLPTTEITSSRQENLAYDVAIGYLHRDPLVTPLHVVSRLDVCTSGLVPLACHSAAAGVLCHAIKQRMWVRKRYKVLCSSPISATSDDVVQPLPLGSVKHCFRRVPGGDKQKRPSLLRAFDEALLQASQTALENNRTGGRTWQLAELTILSCQEASPQSATLDQMNANVSGKYSSSDTQSGSKYYECLVELVTGRTHQIRLQFAALGFPVVGDSRYEPVAGMLDTGTEDASGDDGTVAFGPEPRIIGLQCCELRFARETFDKLQAMDAQDTSSNTIAVEPTQQDSSWVKMTHEDAEVVFRAGLPWWQSSDDRANAIDTKLTSNRLKTILKRPK